MVRLKRYETQVGSVKVGGENPIVVQSMTNTDTADITKTVKQCEQLAHAGSELIRVAVNTREAAKAVPYVIERLDAIGLKTPIVGDFHFNGHKLLKEIPECAQFLSKYRINPGNVGKGQQQDRNFAAFIETACQYDKPVRIGVNWGSLDQQCLAKHMDENSKRALPWSSAEVIRFAMVDSAVSSANRAIELGLAKDKIILSCKMSGVQDLIAVYRLLAQRCQFPLHLGLTEAGMGSKGIVSSTAALAVLLQEGIGDTIRVSLTPEPNGPRHQEVIVAQEILQCLGLRAFTPLVAACPGCGRTTSTVFQELAKDIQTYVRLKMPEWKEVYDGVENMSLAVMGCVVNGPGESKHANLGISLPGTGEAPVAPVYEDGQRIATLRGENLNEQFKAMIDDYISRKYASVSESAS